MKSNSSDLYSKSSDSLFDDSSDHNSENESFSIRFLFLFFRFDLKQAKN